MKVSLPTAPRAARGPNVDLSRVPNDPPFTAFMGNLPFDVDESEIERFFRGLNVSRCNATSCYPGCTLLGGLALSKFINCSDCEFRMSARIVLMLGSCF